MSRNKRIRLFVEATPLLDGRISGIGHTLMSLVENLQGQELQVILISPFDKMAILKKRTAHLKVGYKSIPMPARGLYLLWKFNLVPPLDLILGRGVYLFPNFRNWQLAFSKSITYVYDLTFQIYPDLVAPKNRAFLARNMAKWLKQTDKLIATSKQTKRDIIQFYNQSPNSIEVIYCGVDQSVYHSRSEAEIKKIRKKYKLTGQYLMFFSTIEPRKNVDGLLDAYGRLPAAIKNKYGLMLIGSKGWLVDETVQEIKRLQSKGVNIVWPQNYVPDEDLPALLSGATALVHPALYEGFGISPLQAMACGTPVIVGDNSSLPEVVGNAGLYASAESPADIAAKIEKLVTDPKLRQRLAAAGPKQAAGFSWNKAASELKQIIIEESSR